VRVSEILNKEGYKSGLLHCLIVKKIEQSGEPWRRVSFAQFPLRNGEEEGLVMEILEPPHEIIRVV
jgi:hypothetical protein